MYYNLQKIPAVLRHISAASQKIHAYILKLKASAVAAIYVNLPTSIAMTYRERKNAVLVA